MELLRTAKSPENTNVPILVFANVMQYYLTIVWLILMNLTFSETRPARSQRPERSGANSRPERLIGWALVARATGLCHHRRRTRWRTRTLVRNDSQKETTKQIGQIAKKTTFQMTFISSNLICNQNLRQSHNYL